MVFSKALRASGCLTCRPAITRSFAETPKRASIPGAYPASARRGFRQAAISSTEHPDKTLEKKSTAEVNEVTDKRATVDFDGVEPKDETRTTSSPSGASADAPWYMQVETPRRPVAPMTERQKLPELPENAPTMLQPLLERISVDLGVDDLTVMDLRHLDPPPALGANLLMLFGTARSEKHLHVSADRLCRWLRSTYKLRPHADGLLGRNELKIKLRRKARRAKLLGSSMSEDHYDDGVRTGWVCVNVGVVEKTTSTPQALPAGFAGFTSHTDGVRIVVQMFTESKREEMALEELWTKTLDRHARKEAGAEAQLEIESPPGSGAISNRTGNTQQSKPFVRSYSTMRPSVFSSARRAFQQVRSVHTMNSTRPEPDSASALKASVVSEIKMGRYGTARKLIETAEQTQPRPSQAHCREVLLDALCTYAEACTTEKAIEELGEGWSDENSTAFLRCFHFTLGALPSEAALYSWLRLILYARDIGHGGYHASGLYETSQRLQSSGCGISRETFLDIVRSLLLPAMTDAGEQSPASLPSAPSNKQIMFVLHLFQGMSERGLDILTEDVFLALHESFALYAPPKETDSVPEALHPELALSAADVFGLPILDLENEHILRLNYLMKLLDLKFADDASQLRLMSAYARQKNWSQFWHLWYSHARRSQPRSPALYAGMFSHIAATNHQAVCLSVLRAWVPEMARETVPVKCEGDVAAAVAQCLRVADPDMGAAARPHKPTEWTPLWQDLRRLASAAAV